MTDGWAVRVVMKVAGGGTSEQIYYAAVLGRAEAEVAVRRHIGAFGDVAVTAEKPISAKELQGMKIGPGRVGQWF